MKNQLLQNMMRNNGNFKFVKKHETPLVWWAIRSSKRLKAFFEMLQIELDQNTRVGTL